MAGGGRLRLFAALPLPEDAVERLERWQKRELALSGARIVPRENLHVTLAFLGSRPAEELGAVAAALERAAAGARRPALSVAGYREAQRVGMLVLADSGGAVSALAGQVAEELERLGVYERERRPWLPHLTVLRFAKPLRLSPALPDLGTISPSEVALYHSVLRPGGAQYVRRQSVALGG